MKTSSRIASQFALRVAILVGVLFIFLNLFFFRGWVSGDAQNLRKYMWEYNKIKAGPESQKEEGIIHFPAATFDPTDYAHYLNIKRIRHIGNRWWMIGQLETEFVGFDVSQNIARQRWLMLMSWLLWATVSGASYILGTMFVRRSLRDLLALKSKLDNRTVEKPTGSLYTAHLPHDDEINIIAHSITKLEQRVQAHYAQLRDFVWHVSHELKTPLMEMRSDIDLIDRTKAFEKLPDKFRTHIQHMQNIIDTMLLLSRLDTNSQLQTAHVSICQIIREFVERFTQVYAEKHIKITFQPSNDIICSAHEELVRTMLSNLLDNACKYSAHSSSIEITTTNHTLYIKNPGIINEHTRLNMREPFRQADKNRDDGMGIWLTLVKQIADLHNRTVTYDQENDNVICTVDFT